MQATATNRRLGLAAIAFLAVALAATGCTGPTGASAKGGTGSRATRTSPLADRLTSDDARSSGGARSSDGAVASDPAREVPTAAARAAARNALRQTAHATPGHAPSHPPAAAAAPPPRSKRSTPQPEPAPVVVRPGGRPGPANTGVPAGTPLSVVHGDVVVTTSGTVIDAKHIEGALIIAASNVTVRRSLIDGNASSDSVVIKSGGNILLEDDEIAVAHPSVSHDAMHVQSATLNRLNIHGGVDGMKLGSNSVVENSWIHGLNYFAHDPAQGGRATHNDAIQIMSGTNIRVLGNYLQAATSNNSAIQITQDSGTTHGVYLANNWATGGGCTFNISGHGPGGRLEAMSGISVTGNRFTHTMRFANCAILTDLQTTTSASGNVYADTGGAVSVQRHN